MRAERGAAGKIQSLRYCAPAVEAAWQEVEAMTVGGRRRQAPAVDVGARLAALDLAPRANVVRRTAAVRLGELDLPQTAFSNWFNAHNFYGDLEDLDAATLEDVQAFFDSYYAPNNAALAIVGDVSQEDDAVAAVSDPLVTIRETADRVLSEVTARRAELEADIRRLESSLAGAERELESFTIRAPRDGIVIVGVNHEGQKLDINDGVNPGMVVLELADPDSQYVQVDGIDFHYKTAGSQGPPVVLLHGFGASLYSWREVMPERRLFSCENADPTLL